MLGAIITALNGVRAWASAKISELREQLKPIKQEVASASKKADAARKSILQLQDDVDNLWGDVDTLWERPKDCPHRRLQTVAKWCKRKMGGTCSRKHHPTR